MTSGSDAWLKRLRASEEHVVPGMLRTAMKFLLDAQNPDEGWAGYAHLPTDLQVTAQVVTAMRLFRQPVADVAAGNAAVWVRTACGSRDSAEDLIALLTVVNTEGQPDGSYAERLRSNLDERTAIVSTALLARALLTAETPREAARPWLEELLARQQSDGSWKSTQSVEESLPVTAWAVRALAPWRDLPHVARAADRGLAYLRSVLREHGWESPVLAGTYVLTAVLRALATGASEPELAEVGLDRLRLSQQADGGWGGGPDEPSSAEHTAAAVIAFAESDGFRYVPFRPARQALSELTATLSDLVKQQRAVNADIDARVEERAAQILSDRDRLQQRVNDLQKNVDDLREQVTELTRHPARTDAVVRSRSISRESTVTYFFLAAMMATLTVGSLILIQNTIIKVTVSAYFGLVSLVGVGLTSGRIRPWPFVSWAGRAAASVLVDEFMDASGPLTARERQDLAYELIEEGAELPPDYARRFFQERVYRQGLDSSVARTLQIWLEDYVSADEGTRKEFLSRLRKTIS